jgi:predicted nuclease of restriction endonuclease-like RecB superfamily
VTEDDLIGRTKRELRERIAKLEAAQDELPRLKRALAALEDKPAPASSGRARSTRADGRSSGRRRPRGANRDAILTVIRERPGVSVGEVANVVSKEGVKKNVVYTTVNKLTKDGLVVKRDGALELAAGT